MINEKDYIEHNGMGPVELKEAIKTAAATGISCFTWGPPGCAKSDIHKQVAAELDMEFRDIRMSYREPVDVHGMPFDKDGWLDWLLPKFLKPAKGGRPVFLFLDELNNAAPSVMAACYQIMLDRAVEDYKLPENWAVGAAGNHETDRAQSNRMGTALANRLIHLYAKVSLDDWVTWANTNGIYPMVIAFILWRSELLWDFDPKRKEKAYPTPRSWEFVSRVMHKGIKESILLRFISGEVGMGAAREFFAFRSMYARLASIPSLLADPLGMPVPTAADECYAVAVGLASAANKDNMGAVMGFAQRFHKPEYLALTVSLARNRDPSVQMTKVFRDWAVENGGAF